MQVYSMRIASVKVHEQAPVQVVQRVAHSSRVTKDFF